MIAPNRSGKYSGSHAVVMVSCRDLSLTFLNSWGSGWSDGGSFSVEDHTVLQMQGLSSPPSLVYFYDVY